MLAGLALASFACGRSEPPTKVEATPPPLSTLSFVYTGNSLSGDVSALALRSDGSLQAVPGSPFRTGRYPRGLAVDERGRRLYVLEQATGEPWSDGSVTAFAIGSDGSLTELAGSPFAVPSNSSDLAVHPAGTFLYVTRYERPGIATFEIQGGGGLVPRPSPPADVNIRSARFLSFSPSGSHLYLASADAIRAFRVETDGGLTYLGGPHLPDGVQTSLAIDPRGRFVFAPMSDYSVPQTDMAVRTYLVEGSGELTQLHEYPMADRQDLTCATADPRGQWLYVADHGDSRILAMRIGSGGELSPLAGSPFATGFMPMSLAIDPAGSFICDANRASDNVWCHALAADGSLGPGTSTAVGRYPQAIAMARPAPAR